MKTSTPTHYELLGVDDDATPAEIKAAWRRVVHLAHPDKGAPAGLFRSLEIAYKVLSNEHDRSVYDRSLKPAGSDVADATGTDTAKAAAATQSAEPVADKGSCTPEGPGHSDGAVPVITPGIRFTPGYTRGLLPLLLSLAADGALTWWLGSPAATLGVLALVVAVNLPIRDPRFRGAVCFAALALAGFQFAQHWQRLVDPAGMLGLSSAGMLVAAHAGLAGAAALSGHDYGQTLRLNRFASRKLLGGYRVFGTRGRSRPGWDGVTARRMAEAVEATLHRLPVITVLHGLRVMNGPTAILLDHAVICGRKIILIRGVYPDTDDYALDDIASELTMAAQLLKRDVKCRTEITTLVVISDVNKALVRNAGAADIDLSDWLFDHLAGAPPVVDRVVFHYMARYLLP